MGHLQSRFDEAVFIGLGSNIGDRHGHLQRAIEYLSLDSRIRLIKCSSFLETAPWGPVQQPDFVNAVAKVCTSYSPFELLRFLKSGEQQLGRTPTEHWGPRIIDMDILLFGNRNIDDTMEGMQLTVPHREICHRRFVLEPLLELAPDLVHPASGDKLQSILAELPK